MNRTRPEGLQAIAGNFDFFLVDLWGCLHDGKAPYPQALAALAALKEAGKTILLVSNAPRRVGAAILRLRALGIADGLYDGFYTSGEIAWRQLKERADPLYAALGRRAYPIWDESDHDFPQGLDLDLVRDPQRADFILALGLAAGETTDDYAEILAGARARDLPLLCANPDLLVHRGGRAEPCAGAIGEAYQALGGRTIYEGKPYPGIYRRILADYANCQPHRILAIGDSLRTDIAGAATIGAGSLLIAGGIHHEDMLKEGRIAEDRLAALSEKFKARPDFVLSALAW